MAFLVVLLLIVFLFIQWRKSSKRHKRKRQRQNTTSIQAVPKIDQSLSVKERWEVIKKSGVPLGPLGEALVTSQKKHPNVLPFEDQLADWERLIVLRGNRKDLVEYKSISATEYLNDYAGKTWGEILGELTGGATLVDGKQAWELIDDKDAKQDLGKMLACCNAELAGMYAAGQSPAPAAFKRAAILFRKAKLYEKEIQICEFYISLINQYCDVSIKLGCRGRNWKNLKNPADFKDRIEKAKVLLEKENQKKLKASNPK